MRIGPPLATLLVGVGLIASAACGSATSEPTSVEPGTRADTDYMFSAIERAAEGGALLFSPSDITEAVPRPQGPIAEHTAAMGARSAELLLIGTVVEVTEGEGRKYNVGVEGEDDEYEVVAFDGPLAAERTTFVTLDVESAVGPSGPVSMQTQTFRVGLIGQEDQDRFLAGLRALDRVAVFLDRVKDGRDEGTLYPFMSGTGLGEVSSDGSLSFPAMGEEAGGFTGTVDTVEELEELVASRGGEGRAANS